MRKECRNQGIFGVGRDSGGVVSQTPGRPLATTTQSHPHSEQSIYGETDWCVLHSVQRRGGTGRESQQESGIHRRMELRSSAKFKEH